MNEAEVKVLETVEKSLVPITPIEISRKTGISHSSARRVTRNLEHKGFIKRLYRGHYVTPRNERTIRGVGLGVSLGGLGVVSYGLHCLVLKGRLEGSVVSRWVGGKACVVYDSEFFTVRIMGYANGTVIVYVDCKDDYSFNLSEFQLLLAFLSAVLDVDVSGFEAVTYEFNHDLAGVKLEGVKAVTVKALNGAFKRAYQKSKDVVRVEGKDSVPLPLTQVSALLQGGVPYYELVQSNAMLAKAIQAREQGEEGRFRILINELFKRDDYLRALVKAFLKRLNEEDATTP